MKVHTKRFQHSRRRTDEPERRRFTSAEVLAMEEAGVFAPEERVELIDGEIIAKSPKSSRHENMRTLVAHRISRQTGDDVLVGQEVCFRLAEDQEPVPDVLVFATEILSSDVRGDTALLVIEVAVTSVSYDLQVKAPIYAAHGVREYWVVDARRLVTHVHLEPQGETYTSVREVAADEMLVPSLLPSVSLRLADLGLPPLGDDQE